MGDSPIKTFLILILIGFLVFSYFNQNTGNSILKSSGDAIKGLMDGMFNFFKNSYQAAPKLMNVTNTSGVNSNG